MTAGEVEVMVKARGVNLAKRTVSNHLAYLANVERRLLADGQRGTEIGYRLPTSQDVILRSAGEVLTHA